MPSLFKRGKFWQVAYVHKGHRRHKTLKAKSRAEAILSLNDFLLELATPAAPAIATPSDIPTTLTLSQLYNQFAAWAPHHVAKSTLGSYHNAYNQFSAHSATQRVEHISAADIDAFKRARLAKHITPRTINIALISLKAMVNRAIKENWYSGPNPFARATLLRQTKRQPQWLSAEQFEQLLASSQKFGRNAYLFFALGLLAGMRKNETINATWEWFDFQHNLITITQSKQAIPTQFSTKSHADRVIPLHTRLRKILEPYRHKTGYLIAPEKLPGKYSYRFEIRKTFAHVIADAKLPFVTPHTLRHTFASRLVIAGVSIYKVSQWLGHSDIKTTMIYAHLAPADKDINRL